MSGYALTTGGQNTLIGTQAAQNISTGSNNVAVGQYAGQNVTTGSNNTFLGYNTGGSSSITNAMALGNGASVSSSNTIKLGDANITDVYTSGLLHSKGLQASSVSLTSTTDVTTIASPSTGTLVYNTANAGTSPNNVAANNYYYWNGSAWQLLLASSSANTTNFNYDIKVNGITVGLGKNSNTSNTALGTSALNNNSGGYNNTALGNQALITNTSGYQNTSVGNSTLTSNNSGYSNTAIGHGALYSITTGNSNTAVGQGALQGSNGNESYNTAVGINAGQSFTGSNNMTFIGNSATQSNNNLSNSTALGSGATVSASNQVKLGNSCNVVADGSFTGTAFMVSSDARLKTGIASIQNALALVMRLNPVNYLKKSTINLDAKGYDRKENGFVAQEIKKVLPYVVYEGTDKDKLLAVDYTSLIPVLTKAIQEQQKQIDELKALVEKLADAKK
jgi:hypothetical protein